MQLVFKHYFCHLQNGVYLKTRRIVYVQSAERVSALKTHFLATSFFSSLESEMLAGDEEADGIRSIV
jgi:hypothetical protein